MYAPSSAIAYAHRFAHSRNPAYANFDKLGGDCTNFISQCLHAGGLPLDYQKDTGWYFNSLNDRAAAWSGVNFLYKWLMRKNYAIETSKEKTALGSVIQLSFDGLTFAHSLLVVETKPAILIATHTLDGDNRPLSSYNFLKARYLHIK